MRIMKKLILLILTGILLLTVTACSFPLGWLRTTEDSEVYDPENTLEESAVTGGYTLTDSPVLTDQAKYLLSKATEKKNVDRYEPIAYLGSQIVAGTNYRILCRDLYASPDGLETYVIVIVFEDLDGHAMIADVLECGAEAGRAGQTGGWQEPETPEMTDNADEALQKAAEAVSETTYDSVALVATQVVAGTNYCILCKIAPASPENTSGYAMVYVYEDLQENATITETLEFHSTR